MVSAGVILKTVERCNINCTYCYYFNSNDQSYKTRKPYINSTTVDTFVQFLKQGIDELNITHLLVEFHGGEPLMQKKNDFIKMCSFIKDQIKDYSTIKSLKFALQTNGILIDLEWIEIFKKYNIGIGISLDGNQEINDQFRLDKKGNSTYDAVVKKIKLCQDANLKFGLLSVVNPTIDGREIYRHFVDTLKLEYFDFLIPDANHTSLPIYPQAEYGRFMSEVFNEWTKDNGAKPKIFIRFCINALELFLGHYSRVEGFGKRNDKVLPLICVSNNGDLGPLDDLRTCVPEMFVKKNITNTSWAEFLKDDFFSQFLHDMNTTPDACKECCWEKPCGGGAYSHRYDKKENNFSRKSIYCSSIKYFYKDVFKYFIKNGYTKDQMTALLGIV